MPDIEVPGGNLLDRADGVNRAGLAVGWSDLDDSDVVDFTALRFDLHGQYLIPVAGQRIGGYAILPVSYARIDPEMGPTNAEWVVADGELGGVWRRGLTPGLDLAAHLGVTLPFARQGTLSSTEVTGFGNEFAVYARPNDLVHSFPEATYLRLGATPIFWAGTFFARGDVAVDVPLRSGVGDDLTTIGRINGAVGTRILAHGALMLELVNLIALEKPADEEADRLLTFVGVTYAGVDRLVEPTFSLLFPFDDEINDAVGMAFIVGAVAMLP